MIFMMDHSLVNQKLKSLIRNISRSHLLQQGHAESVQIKDIREKPLVYSHWMSIILVTGDRVRITFKTHFKTRNGQLLAAPLFGLPSQQVKIEQAIDCMREYCNLTGGGIKRALFSYMELQLSLPIITRGFDEIFFAAYLPTGCIEDRWLLTYGDNEILCSSTIEWIELTDLSDLDELHEAGFEKTTEIEYL